MSSISKEAVGSLARRSVLRILLWQASCGKGLEPFKMWICLPSLPRSSHRLRCECTGCGDCSSTLRKSAHSDLPARCGGRQQRASIPPCIGSIRQWYECNTPAFLCIKISTPLPTHSGIDEFGSQVDGKDAHRFACSGGHFNQRMALLLVGFK